MTEFFEKYLEEGIKDHTMFIYIAVGSISAVQFHRHTRSVLGAHSHGYPCAGVHLEDQARQKTLQTHRLCRAQVRGTSQKRRTAGTEKQMDAPRQKVHRLRPCRHCREKQKRRVRALKHGLSFSFAQKPGQALPYAFLKTQGSKHLTYKECNKTDIPWRKEGENIWESKTREQGTFFTGTSRRWSALWKR